jgi:hypothetical protein
VARTLAGGERAQMAAAHVNHHLKVEVRDTGGTWRDLSALSGINWVDQCEITEDIDQSVMSFSLTLRRESQGQSLAPLLTTSGPNTITGGYSPLLYGGRRVRISTAVTAAGVAPGGYKLMGEFKIDTVDWGNSEVITVNGRDIGAWLLDTQIEDVNLYGQAPTDPTPVLIQAVVQAIIDDYPPPGGATLVVINDPLFAILQYAQDKVKVGEAIATLALQAASDVRYRFRVSDDAFVLALWKPDRAKVAPDWTLGPTEYEDVTNLSTSDADVRNVVRVKFTDHDTQIPDSFTASDATSITLFGRRYMEIVEEATSQIDTLAEAIVMASAARDDLSLPKADQEIKTKLLWFVQLGDLGRFSANGVHYNGDQDLAVVGIKHVWADGEANTFVKTRGKPAGAFRRWLNVPPGSSPNQLMIRVLRDSVTDTQVTARVYVGDGIPDAGPVRIFADGEGIDSVLPTEELLIPPPAGSDIITPSLLTTAFRDFAITRPEPGQPQGRVTFRAERVNDPRGTVTASIDVIPRGEYSTPQPVIGPVTAEATAENGNAEGCIHIPILFEPSTAEVRIYTTESPDNPPPVPELVENMLSATVIRHEGDIASAPDWQTEIDVSTTPGWYRRIICLPIGPTGVRGQPFTSIDQAVDGIFAPMAPPSGLGVGMTVVAGRARATLIWVNGDVLAETRVFRNGIVLTRVAAGVATLVDDGITPDVAYEYQVQHILLGATSEFSSGGITPSDTTQLQPAAFAATYPRNGGYDTPVDDPPPNGQVYIRVVNPDPFAATEVWMNNNAADVGGFSFVYGIPAGQTDALLNAADMPGTPPTNLDRWFYLVAVRPNYLDSVASAHATARFGV